MLAGALFLLLAGHLAATYAGRALERPALGRPPDVDAIAGWMTIPYIARVYGTPERALLAAIQLPASAARHRSLQSIARSQNKPPEQVIAAVRAAVLANRSLPAPTPSQPTPRALRPRRPGVG